LLLLMFHSHAATDMIEDSDTEWGISFNDISIQQHLCRSG
jgi:hypothetical protein